MAAGSGHIPGCKDALWAPLSSHGVITGSRENFVGLTYPLSSNNQALAFEPLSEVKVKNPPQDPWWAITD